MADRNGSVQQGTQRPQGETETAQGRTQPTAMERSARGRSTGLGRQGISSRLPFAMGAFSMFPMMREIMNEMDRMFEDFGMGRGGLLGTERGTQQRGIQAGAQAWAPQVEVFQRQGQLVVRADLPGLSKDDVRLTIEDDALILQGERRQEREETREGVYHSEVSYGSFCRAIPLPDGVNPDDVNATFTNGVLECTVKLPQQQQQRGRTVPIREAAQQQQIAQPGGNGGQQAQAGQGTAQGTPGNKPTGRS